MFLLHSREVPGTDGENLPEGEFVGRRLEANHHLRDLVKFSTEAIENHHSQAISAENVSSCSRGGMAMAQIDVDSGSFNDGFDSLSLLVVLCENDGKGQPERISVEGLKQVEHLQVPASLVAGAEQK